MKNIQSRKTWLGTLMFSAGTLLFATSTSVSAAPTTVQTAIPFNEDCYSPTGSLISSCSTPIFLEDAQIPSNVELFYFADGSLSIGTQSHACITLPGSDLGIVGSDYDSLLPTNLLSSLTFAASGESVSQTSPVRENDLTTTPTICTRQDDTIANTYYMAVFPPFLQPDSLTMTPGNYEPANTPIPTTPVEEVCLGSETYAECETKALASYTVAYGADAVPLLLSTQPADDDDAVDPTTTAITLTFNEPVAPGITAGNGYLFVVGNPTAVETFNANDPNVALDSTGTVLTVTLANPLMEGTDYFVEIEIGALGSQATSKAYPGITFNDTWNFTTNSHPVLSSPSVTGVPRVLSVLTAIGSFSDSDIGDTAGTHLYQWYSSIDNTCTTNDTVITGATNSTYTPVPADAGKYICVGITPEDNHGLLGTEVFDATSLVIGKAVQTITFNDPADVTYSPGLTFNTTTSSSAGLPIDVGLDLTSSSIGVCSVSNNVVTVLTAGTCDLIAHSTDDATYSLTASKLQSVTISQAPQTIAFADPSDVTYSPGLTFNTPTNSDSGLAVIVGSSSTSVCTVTSNVVTVLTAGTCSLVAAQNGDTNYMGAAAVTQSVTIAQAAQAITFTDPADHAGAVGSTFSAPASVDSGLTTTLSSTTPLVCTVSASTVTVVNAGTCNLSASQGGDTNYSAATAVNRSVVITTNVDLTSVTQTGGGGSITLIELLLGIGLASLLYRRKSVLRVKRAH